MLYEFEFEIKHYPKKENIVANAFSCKYFVYAILMPYNPILAKVKEFGNFDVRNTRAC